MQLKYQVYYAKVPRKDICPVILLHSMFEDRKTWTKIAPIIADRTGRVVYTPDMRNHGESPWNDEYTIDALADDLDGFILEHGLSKVILVGHSLGGKVAIKYTLMRPNKVDKLLLEDASAQSISVRGKIPITAAAGAMQTIEKFIPVGFDKAQTVNYIREFGQTMNTILRLPRETIADYDIDLLPFDFSDLPPKVQLNMTVIFAAVMEDKLQMNISGTYQGDVLLLHGTKSQFMGETGTQMEHLFPRIKKIPLADCSHFIHQQKPEDFTRIVIDFINSSSVEWLSKF